MLILGMKHISEGTDHLLFLLVLLLSAPLIAANKKWLKSGTIKYSFSRIFKIVTAFTVGHSISLILGTCSLLNFETKWVEILIAISILVTAIHAIKPIFPNKEIYVAAGFGMIHGLAFATILTNLHLDNNKLVLSLLGFNIGIELMQLFIILLIMPWFIILSSFKIYTWVRIIMAFVAGIASVTWVIERYTESPNIVSKLLENGTTYSIEIIFIFACFTIIFYIFKHYIKSDI